MQDETITLPVVTVNVEHPMFITDPEAPDLGTSRLALASIEVTVSAAHPTAFVLNAAAVAADTALRAIDKAHPAHRSAQCGRTYVHLGHQTTEGHCAGLDGTEGMTAGRTIPEAP